MELSSENSIAVVAFPEEPVYPRLSRAVLRELREHLRAVQAAGCFEGLIVAANSRSFATGAQLEEVSALGGVTAFEFARSGQALMREIESSPLPVVAAIRGLCLGGGLDMALACRCRVAAYDSSFASPGAALGLVTGWGGTQRLARLVGRAAAMRMLLTAERIPASQALGLGLVDELVPSADLIHAAARRARQAARSGGAELGR